MTFQPDLKQKMKLEKYSSAFTLSDMEIFIFPELFYALVLANIMSPEIWTWRNETWFKNIHKKSFTYKVNRIKQYIMDNFVFNLDLETWGLTTKEKEIERFKDFCDIDLLKKSNALFGYEGDKYYFSIDIRRHFGLDKYNSEVIPFWKTETVEAMKAFRYKKDYPTGAGECVSLSALYAAAMFIVGEIPLEDIYLIATPLHSQNYINQKKGVITNNRRIVTKNMWFNGTSLSAKARRALENERITIVSHLSGYIHTMYKEATINPGEYATFRKSLSKYLKADLDSSIISNFLRNEIEFRSCFQYIHKRRGKKYFIETEKIFEYEHNSRHNFTAGSRDNLLDEIDTDEYRLSPISNRIVLNAFEAYLDEHKEQSLDEIEAYFYDNLMIEKCRKMQNMFDALRKFIEVKPNFPNPDKKYIETKPLSVSPQQSRQEIINHIYDMTQYNETANLSQYAYRQMDKIDWQPFIKAAIERNPVSLEALQDNTIDEVYVKLEDMPNQSIYDECRLALPDEVWNFQRGDGIEKAILLAGFIHENFPKESVSIRIHNGNVHLETDFRNYTFVTHKALEKKIRIENEEVMIDG